MTTPNVPINDTIPVADEFAVPADDQPTQDSADERLERFDDGADSLDRLGRSSARRPPAGQSATEQSNQASQS